MSNKKPVRINALLVATQAVAGTPETLDPVTDQIIVEDLQRQFDPQTVQSAENSGTLDDNEGNEVTGIRGGVTFVINLTGEGAAGQEPRYARILQACSWQLQLTPTAIGPTACQAGGSTTQVPLDAGASAVDDAYTGMPINLTGDMTVSTFVIAYDGTTKVATVLDTLPGVPTISTNYEFPANARLRPGSGIIPMLTTAAYIDDVKYLFEGCRGNAVFEKTTAGLVRARVTLQGNWVETADEAAPTEIYDRMNKIKFLGGKAHIDGVPVAVSTVSLDPQASLAFDPNPNLPQGFDAPEITGRDMQLTIDPNLVSAATRNTIDNMSRSKEHVVHTIAGKSTEAGNRLSMLVPRGMISGYAPGERSNIATEQLTMTCKGADAGAFLCLY